MGARDEFDESAYKQLKVVGSFQPEGKKARIEAAIFQYGENEPKLKIQRVGTRKEGEYRSDLGGMTADEAEAVAKLCADGAKALKKLK